MKALVCVCSLYRTKKIPFGNHADTCYIRSREEGNVTTITLDVFRLAGYPLEFFDNGAAITHTAHKDRFICFFFCLFKSNGTICELADMFSRDEFFFCLEDGDVHLIVTF